MIVYYIIKYIIIIVNYNIFYKSKSLKGGPDEGYTFPSGRVIAIIENRWGRLLRCSRIGCSLSRSWSEKFKKGIAGGVFRRL